MRDGVMRLQEIARHPDVQAIATRADYGMSGRSIDEPFAPKELEDWMFAECSDAQHASGTCRMGAVDDPHSVVDPECRVIGCTGLRVIDASIMPTVVRANTHFTTVMIAEKMADRLRQRAAG
jgi:5-(hydroxymethyl)furfural/furfural oxidase